MTHIRKGAVCGDRFTAPRSDALYCSNRCRQKAHRDRERDRAVTASRYEDVDQRLTITYLPRMECHLCGMPFPYDGTTPWIDHDNVCKPSNKKAVENLYWFLCEMLYENDSYQTPKIETLDFIRERNPRVLSTTRHRQFQKFMDSLKEWMDDLADRNGIPYAD